MTFGNDNLKANVKETSILPIVFICPTLPEELEDYALDENKLALFLDSDNYSVNLEGESNFIYHNQFDSGVNVIDINYKRPVLSMQFLYHDYKIFKFLKDMINTALENYELLEIIDYHYLKTRYILPTSLTISGGTHRSLRGVPNEPTAFEGRRYLPEGFRLTAVENKLEIM